MSNQEEEEEGLAGRGQLGGALLPSDCGLSEGELLDRIARNEPCSTPEEYLARVALEAKSLPHVVSIPVNSSNELMPIATTAVKRLGSNWQAPQRPRSLEIPPAMEHRFSAILQAFVGMRNELQCWEQKLAQEERSTSLRPVSFPTSVERLQWLEFFAQTPPLMHVLLQMDNVNVVRALKHFAKAFALDPAIIHHENAAWVFALLARVEIPYTDDTASSLALMLRTVSARYEDDKFVCERGEILPHLLVHYLLQDYFKA